jgi:nucleotide-binding universal stress UspA family protein
MAALNDAASLARKFEAQLLILHVDERFSPTGEGETSFPAGAADWRGLFEKTLPAINGVKFERHFAHGNPCEEIPRFAESHDVDLVVMAHHTAQERMHCRTDGVCANTSRHCERPVMTVRHVAQHPPWVCVDGDGWSPL